VSDFQKLPEAGEKSKCALHEEMLEEIHLAVCGCERIGVTGLVSEVRELKNWRRKMDLRVAKIAGGTAVLMILAEYLIKKI
jgi:hypothetical protein